jgi:hypothetical protein
MEIFAHLSHKNDVITIITDSPFKLIQLDSAARRDIVEECDINHSLRRFIHPHIIAK